MGKIIDSQLDAIKKFSCVKISDLPADLNMHECFKSDLGAGFVDYLCERAKDEDVLGRTGCYLVQDQDGEFPMYFTLKTGIVFSKPVTLSGLAARLAIYEEQEQEATEIKRARLKDKVNRHKNYLSHLQDDIINEANELILRVEGAAPGLEIVQFCANDLYRDKWDGIKQKSGFNNYTMGQVLFWGPIFEKILDVQKMVGFTYLFLYAADHSIDGECKLLGYYSSLGFRRPLNVGTVKPPYDLNSIFMLQHMDEMKRNRRAFFNDFNPSTLA